MFEYTSHRLHKHSVNLKVGTNITLNFFIDTHNRTLTQDDILDGACSYIDEVDCGTDREGKFYIELIRVGKEYNEYTRYHKFVYITKKQDDELGQIGLTNLLSQKNKRKILEILCNQE